MWWPFSGEMWVTLKMFGLLLLLCRGEPGDKVVGGRGDGGGWRGGGGGWRGDGGGWRGSRVERGGGNGGGRCQLAACRWALIIEGSRHGPGSPG